MQLLFHRFFLHISFIVILLSVLSLAQSQEKNDKNDTFFLAKKKGLMGEIGKSMSISNSKPVDSLILAVKSINPFLIYKGSIIKKLTVRRIVYGQSVNDTSKIFENSITKFVNKLHVSTTERSIRNNLFFKAGDTLYPILVADNERFLRNLPYLQDARIFAKESDDSDDGVDLIVLYKDVFPIGGSADANNTKNLFLEGYDDNLMGHGERLTIQTLYDLDRNPKMGFGAEFLKRNIKGSFVDFTVGYKNLSSAFNNGYRQENTMYSKIELPLVSPYHLWTGALETSLQSTNNDYVSDSLYRSDYNYRYDLFDAWVGYNISGKNLLHESNKRKMKKFLAARIVKKDFLEVPEIYKNQYNFQYADQRSLLVSFIKFKQEYYRTSFIYGFGRNEDVPEGFNYSFIGGWTNKENHERPYSGVDFQRSYFSKKQNYFNFIFKAGAYISNFQMQDISLLGGLESFTKLRRFGNSNWLYRQFINASITQQLNTFLNEPLVLNSQYGLPEFSNPDTTGTSRITINSQTVFYNTWRYLGFSFAPFSFASLCYLKPMGKDISKGDVYTSIGAGLRTRNENLVFGTIELKVAYYQRTTQGMSPWNISVSSNLQFKYNSQYIKRPDFVTVN